jgi:hypothetical protein
MKKYAIGIIAFILAIAGSAFTAHKSHPAVKAPLSGPWYYEYSLSTATGENTASNYTFIDPQPLNPRDVEGCSGSGIPCVIQATGTTGVSGMPDASEVSTTNLPGNTKVQKASQ